MNIPKNFYIEGVLLNNSEVKPMEEILYNIEIHKEENKFLGRIFSDVDGIKEFKNERLDELLRDMTLDMQLALDEFTTRSTDFSETHEDHK